MKIHLRVINKLVNISKHGNNDKVQNKDNHLTLNRIAFEITNNWMILLLGRKVSSTGTGCEVRRRGIRNVVVELELNCIRECKLATFPCVIDPNSQLLVVHTIWIIQLTRARLSWARINRGRRDASDHFRFPVAREPHTPLACEFSLHFIASVYVHTTHATHWPRPRYERQWFATTKVVLQLLCRSNWTYAVTSTLRDITHPALVSKSASSLSPQAHSPTL